MTRYSMGSLVVVLGLTLAGSGTAFAQAAPPAGAPTSSPDDDDDTVIRPEQPDFTLVALPTALRVPRHKSAFRVTHRFRRALGEGTFGDLAGSLFGIDEGAQIGLEYRYGLIKGGQVGFYRTSDRTIEFFGEYNVLGQDRWPVGVAAFASTDGTNNFRDSYTPALGVILSRTVGSRAGLYVEPMWVNNSNPLPKAVVDHNNTAIIGLGARVRLGAGSYLTGEVTPRVAGYRPGVPQGSIAIEKRVGGHVFQLNFSNGIGTTMGQVARGGVSSNDWFMGFNISRKFF